MCLDREDVADDVCSGMCRVGCNVVCTPHQGCAVDCFNDSQNDVVESMYQNSMIPISFFNLWPMRGSLGQHGSLGESSGSIKMPCTKSVMRSQKVKKALQWHSKLQRSVDPSFFVLSSSGASARQVLVSIDSHAIGGIWVVDPGRRLLHERSRSPW